MTVLERLTGHASALLQEIEAAREERADLESRLVAVKGRIAAAEEELAELHVAINVVRERDIRTWRDDAGLVNVGVAPHGPGVPA